mgnify:CR=1 FL=1
MKEQILAVQRMQDYGDAADSGSIEQESAVIIISCAFQMKRIVDAREVCTVRKRSGADCCYRIRKLQRNQSYVSAEA